MQEVKNNVGGIVLDYGDNEISLPVLQRILLDRVKRSEILCVDIIILRGSTAKILRYKK